MSDGDDSKQSGGGAAAESPESLGYVEPDYDIGDVRRALRELYQEMRSQHATKGGGSGGAADESSLHASYCAVLHTLGKVAGNLLRSPLTPAHLRFNLRSPAVLAKFGSYAGARALLRFLGFQERLDVESHSMHVEEAELPTLRIRIQRAIVLLAKVREEHAPPAPAQSELDAEGMADVAGGSASGSGSVAAVAPSSVFLANVEGDEDGAALRSASPPPPPDEEMRPDLAPTYVIGEVRTALNQLYSEVEASMPPPAAAAAPAEEASTGASPPRATPFQLHLHRLCVRDAYCAVLDTLGKVAGNLVRSPPNPAHLRINLANATVHKKFAQFSGAVLFLRFLGFKEPEAAVTTGSVSADSANVDAVSPTAAASSDAQSQLQQQLLVLPEADLIRDTVKISRALSILQKARSDAAPTPQENEQRALGPVDRAARLFDLNVLAVAPARAHGSAGSLPSPAEDEGDAGRADLSLLMAAAAAERKRVHELSRTDVIVTKQKQAEIREASKRRYHSTLVKVTFTDKSAVQAPQGQGRYGGGDSGSRVAGGGYRLGLKANYGMSAASSSPSAAPAAATSPGGGPVPMDEGEDDGDEKESSVPVALPVAMPVSPVAAAAAAAAAASAPSSASAAPASVTVSPPPAPAAPAAEVMLSAYFRPWETLADLFAFIQTQLGEAGRHRAFYLHLPPNVKFQCGGEDKQGKHAAVATKSLQSLGLVPAAAMIFHYCAETAPANAAVATSASASASASAPSPAAVAGGVVATLRSDLLARREPYDAHALAGMIPAAENKDQLEAQKAKLLADTKAAATGGSKHGASASSSSGGGGGSLSLGAGSDDDDLDMEAYMRAKKKATLTGKGGKATSSSGSGSGSSASSGSAASKRNIPGLFKPRV